MAETVRQIPEKYSEPEYVFHPRLSSYGRRLGAALPPLLMALAAGGALWLRRPAGPVIALLVAVILVAGLMAYAHLRPALAVITRTHVLSSRWIGFHAVPRAAIRQVVTADRLLPAQPEKSRSKGRPYLWLVGENGKRLMALDGIVWDLTSLKTLGDRLEAQHVNFKRATPGEIRAHWPGLVSWRLTYPRLRYALTSLLLLLVLALVVWLSFVTTTPGN